MSNTSDFVAVSLDIYCELLNMLFRNLCRQTDLLKNFPVYFSIVFPTRLVLRFAKKSFNVPQSWEIPKCPSTRKNSLKNSKAALKICARKCTPPLSAPLACLAIFIYKYSPLKVRHHFQKPRARRQEGEKVGGVVIVVVVLEAYHCRMVIN